MVSSVETVSEFNPRDDEVDRRLRFYEKGETIPLVPGEVLQVCQGVVQFSIFYPTGEEGLLGWAAPSACFSLNLTCLQTYRAMALSDVYLLWFSMTDIEASPQLAQKLLPELGTRLRQMEALLAITGQRRVEDRLYQLLLLLKREFGEEVPGGTRLQLRLTHQEIANAICTTRVTITRLLGKLQQRGWIIRDQERYITLTPEAFVNIPSLF